MASVYDFQNQGKELENLLRLKGYGLPKPAPTSTAIPSAATVAKNLMTPETASTPFVPQIQRKKSVTDTTKKGLLNQYDTGTKVTKAEGTDTKEQSVTPTYGDPAETMRLLKEYQGAPEVVGLRENAENLRGMAQELAGRSPSGFAGLDLSPLIAYADAKSGMNLLKGYNAPKGGRMYDTISLMKEADKVESQAAGLPLQYLKATQGQKISGVTGKQSLAETDTTNEKMSQMLNEIKTMMNSQGTGSSTDFGKEVQRFNIIHGKELKQYGSEIKGAEDLEKIMREMPSSGMAFAKRQMARLAGEKGVMTEKDVQDFVQLYPSWANIAKAWVGQRFENIADEKNASALQAIARIKKARAAQSIAEKLSLIDESPEYFPALSSQGPLSRFGLTLVGRRMADLDKMKDYSGAATEDVNLGAKKSQTLRERIANRVAGRPPKTSSPSNVAPMTYQDAEKEARYQAWKASQK